MFRSIDLKMDTYHETEVADVIEGLKNYNPIHHSIVLNNLELHNKAIELDIDKILRAVEMNRKEDIQPIVGILVDSTYEFVISTLTSLRLNIKFYPISPNLSVENIKKQIDVYGINVVFTSKEFVQILNILQWECKDFYLYICLDEEKVLEVEESQRLELMNENLWNYISRRSTNIIEGGGWYSSYTGNPLSKEDMSDYAENIEKRLIPFLDINTRVLEIGCASGITLLQIAPLVNSYVGIDLSKSMVLKTRDLVNSQGMKNVRIDKLAAHEVSSIEDNAFDVIIINSVCQYFPGYNYFRNVLRQIIDKIERKGIIFIGDIMNLDTRNTLIEDLNFFRKQSKEGNYLTKLDFNKELFFSKGFFNDIQYDFPSIERVEVQNKNSKLKNELNLYRFDTLLKVNKEVSTIKKSKTKKIKLQVGIELSKK